MGRMTRVSPLATFTRSTILVGSAPPSRPISPAISPSILAPLAVLNDTISIPRTPATTPRDKKAPRKDKGVDINCKGGKGSLLDTIPKRSQKGTGQQSKTELIVPNGSFWLYLCAIGQYKLARNRKKGLGGADLLGCLTATRRHPDKKFCVGPISFNAP